MRGRGRGGGACPPNLKVCRCPQAWPWQDLSIPGIRLHLWAGRLQGMFQPCPVGTATKVLQLSPSAPRPLDSVSTWCMDWSQVRYVIHLDGGRTRLITHRQFVRGTQTAVTFSTDCKNYNLNVDLSRLTLKMGKMGRQARKKGIWSVSDPSWLSGV